MKQINTIFLIDDDTLTNFLNQTIIRRVGYNNEIQAFEKPAFALDALQQLTSANDAPFPEMILLDVNMPQMNGWDFLEEYEKLPLQAIAKTKVYIVSSSINNRDIEKSKTYKTVSGFISKPLDTEKMNEILKPQGG
jgi:CheY-like chemotaxis protein